MAGPRWERIGGVPEPHQSGSILFYESARTLHRRPAIEGSDAVTVLLIPGRVDTGRIGTAQTDAVHRSVKPSYSRPALVRRREPVGRRAAIDRLCARVRWAHGWLARHPAIRSVLRHPLEVDIPTFDIRMDQLNTNPVANVKAFHTALQFSFDGRQQQTDPRPFLRRTGDDGIELLSDP